MGTALTSAAGGLSAASLAAASHYLVRAAVAVGAIAVIVSVALARRSGSAAALLPMPGRVRLRMHPGPGFARGRRMLRRRAGRTAARKSARRTRPALTRRQIRRARWQEYASFVGWAAHGWLAPTRIYATFEQLCLVIAGPQKGKSAMAAGKVLDAPGPVVATSIRGDLIRATAGLRQRCGEVLVFGLGGGPYRSTIQWCVVAGCQDLMTAVRRAGYLVEGQTTRGLEDAGFWRDQASMVLASLLHAAGLAGGSLRDVYEWILHDSTQPLSILSRHPAAVAAAAGHLGQYLELPDRTRSGIRATLLATLRFMLVPQVAEAACPPPGGSIDMDAFLQSRDTLYLVADDTAASPVAPLFSALLAEMTFRARTLGGAAPAGRLDPPLSLELDEAPNLTPVPIAAWATWAAGSGIRMTIHTQSFAQLAERWGQLGAETIWQACDTKVIYAGTSEESTSRKVQEACGLVVVRAHGAAPDGAAARTEQPVMPFAALRQLPAGRAVVISNGIPPLIVRTERFWRRADVRNFTRRGGRPLLPMAVQPVLAAAMPGLMDAPAGPASLPAGDTARLRRVS